MAAGWLASTVDSHLHLNVRDIFGHPTLTTRVRFHHRLQRSRLSGLEGAIFVSRDAKMVDALAGRS